MPIALIAIEDFLFEEDKVRGRHPILDTMRLVNALTAAYKIILSSGETDMEKLEYLLQTNGIIQGRSYDQIVLREPQWADHTLSELRVEHFRYLRVNRGEVSLFVDSDSTAAAAILQAGGNILLWNRALYVHPDFRPVRTRPVPWAELAQEAEHQQFLRRQDERLNVQHEASDFEP